MADERKHRVSYYDKVGICGVDEKKLLEKWLKDRPFDKDVLKKFCLRATVPAMYRTQIWKVLFGVIPDFEESHAFIMSQRRAEYSDLQKALKDVKIIDDSMAIHQQFVAMWLLRYGRTKIDINLKTESRLTRAMLEISERFWNIITADKEQNDVTDIYWLLCGFLNHVYNFHKEIPQTQESLYPLILSEDAELYNHLVHHDLLHKLPCENWFYSCFAGIIKNNSIAKIWDKIVAGAFKILVYIEAIMLMALRQQLLQATTVEEVVKILTEVNEETYEILVNKAIDLWQKTGSTPISPSPNKCANM